MKIYLVRHAEAENWHGKDLSRRGIKQSRFLGKRLKKIKFDEFYCSDLSRAKQTSEVVAKIIKLEPRIEPSLNEYKSSDIKNSDVRWSKEERLRKKQLIDFLSKISKDKNKEKNILIIAHGITNRIILAHLLDLPLNKMIIFRQNNTCVNEFFWNNKFKNWRIVRMNDDSHLSRRLIVNDRR